MKKVKFILRVLNKSIKLLHDSINEIRFLFKRLSAPWLVKIQLEEFIKESVESVSTTRKLKISLNTSGVHELDVSQEVHLALYRILQEHLTNILKHAAASSIETVLGHITGHILLPEKDDGKGFDAMKNAKGLALQT